MAERQAASAEPQHRWSHKQPKQKSVLQEFHRPPTPPRDWTMFRRELLKFGAVLVVVGCISGIVVMVTSVTNAKTKVTNDAKSGVTELQAGFTALGQSQSDEATKHFTKAQSLFNQANATLTDTLPGFAEHLPVVGKQVSGSTTLVHDAGEIASIGKQLAELLPTDALKQPAVTIQSNGVVQGSIGVLASLSTKHDELLTIVNQAKSVLNDIRTVSPDAIPSAYRERFISAQRILNGFVPTSASLDDMTTFLLGLLAPKESKEYLVVFQNNDEIRPTGGFLGTFLLVQFEGGTFKILDAPGNGPFALSDLIAKKNLPPQPLLSIVPYWTFHDSNWFLDAPTSAKTMIDFYKQDRGFAPDGVLFLTPGIMEDILRITGPVRPEHYAVDISAENFVAATEQQVQFGYDKALNNPKQFLIDLVPTMITKLSTLGTPDALKAMAMTLKRFNQNDIMVYSSDKDVQNAVATLGWDGALNSLTGDGLAVVDTNLGGGKTDRSITEKVTVNVTLQNGLLQHQVQVTRTHHGTAGNILTGDTNRDFLRIYTPSNAQFTSITGATIPNASWWQTPSSVASMPNILQTTEGQTLVDQANGYRITHESGRMVFGAWSQIAPGQSQTITFTYTTPAPTGDNTTWNFDWQHQPGAVPARTWIVNFSLPSGKTITSTSSTAAISNGKKNASFTSDSTISREFSVNYK